jgi:hypothetical protein
MSFLANIARRGAGLPVSPIRVPAAPALAGVTAIPAAPDVGIAQTQGAAQADVGSTAIPLSPVVERAATGSPFVAPPVLAPFETTGDPPSQAQVQVRTLDQPAFTAKAIRAGAAESGIAEARVTNVAASADQPASLVTAAPATQGVPLPVSITQSFKSIAVVAERGTPLRPASADTPIAAALPRLRKPSSNAQPEPAPIHIRIGRIEVRGKTADAPAPRPAKPALAPLGFAKYARQRTYRNWPL